MIKSTLKKIIAKIIEIEARLVLRKYKPKVVGVTGSVGKTSTKDAVALILGCKFKVRKSEKSFNSEIGVPLTILGCQNAWSSVFGWLRNIFQGLSLIIFKHDYPAWLVLEVGADRPGDIKKLTQWIKFDMAVMTRLPNIPVHVEFFKNQEGVIKEKNTLAKAISASGLVVLNSDDEELVKLKETLKSKVLTYGFTEGADLSASNFNVVYSEEGDLRRPNGLTFKVGYGGSNFPVKIGGLLGVHQAYPVLAALAVGVSQEINFVDMLEVLNDYDVPPGRMRLIKGIKDSTILDDSYNSSPAALEAALVALKGLEVPGRKIAVMGDMMELGAFTVDAHHQAGELASEACDLILTVGVRTKFIDEAAIEKGFPKENILHFDDSVSAGKKLQELIKPGDIILVKGSQSGRMEKVVEEVMLEPDQKEKLLVRQEAEWKKR